MRSNALHVLLCAGIVALSAGGCSCAREVAATDCRKEGCPCGAPSDCEEGLLCVDGACKAPVVIDWDAGSDTDAATYWADIGDINNPRKDADCDGLTNAAEFASTYGTLHRRTDPNDADTDNDGLSDGLEAGATTSVEARCPRIAEVPAQNRTDPTDADSDDDGLPDGVEDANRNGQLDLGETDPRSPDTDGDGLLDGAEDSDFDGVLDPTETDPRKADTDGDNLSDRIEQIVPATDGRNSDTDGDGCSDGAEDANRDGKLTSGESDPRTGGDCVGNQLDADQDGIPDNIEQQQGTDPARADTDGDGLLDKAEDLDGDGTLDAGETSAVSKDTDCDGLDDGLELLGYHTDPRNADSDADGLVDGVEAGVAANPEPGRCPSFVADSEPVSRTHPMRADTDCDGVLDGEEDKNHDGKRSAGETDALLADTDGDGVRDGVEAGVCLTTPPPACSSYTADGDCGATKTDPLNPDSDGDGLSDGEEDLNADGKVDTGETSSVSRDQDCDGLADAEEALWRTDALNPDSDSDGLTDGLEAGRTLGLAPGCSFVGDGDPSSVTTPFLADSDGDGLADGIEDRNKNGRLDAGETNPLNPDSDGDGLRDGLEDVNADGVIAGNETDPVKRDSDGDGIPDGVEDSNRNGVRDPGETHTLNGDSDGDTCLDGEEDKNWNHVVEVGETDPLKTGDCPPPTRTDSDCDGLSDDVEATATHTLPNDPDTDRDGLVDGLEKGVVANPDPGHCGGFLADAEPSRTTDPLAKDTDCDGLLDGAEDANHNGRREDGETDPANPDSDGDGLPDGLEKGVCTGAGCTGFRADGDCGTTVTSPLQRDTDLDGIDDGTEDADQDGVVDSGELNPNAADAQGSDTEACAAEKLKPVQLLTAPGQKADLTVAVGEGYPAQQPGKVFVGADERGMMVFNATHQLAGFAVKLAPVAGADINAQLATIEGRLAAAGVLNDKVAQAFTTWDSFPAVLAQYTFTDTGNNTVGRAANDLVRALYPTATGVLTGAELGSEAGPFRLKLELVRRSANTHVLVGALTKAASLSDARLFALDDLTNGSALAQYGDQIGAQCDRMTVQPRKEVDFLWVVDNSGSMGGEQNAVVLAAQAMADQLAGSIVDARLGVITSDLDNIANVLGDWQAVDFSRTTGAPRYCSFTSDLQQFKSCMGRLGVAGSGSERFFRPFACAMGKGSPATPYEFNCGNTRVNQVSNDWIYSYKTPPGVYPMLTRSATLNPNKLRAGANVVIVFLTDTNEQSDGQYAADVGTAVPAGSLEKIPAWVTFFKNFDGLGKPESRPFVAGLVCPAGGNCSDYGGTPPRPYMNTRWPTFFAQMNGVFADLPPDSDPKQAEKIKAAIDLMYDRAIGVSSPYVLSKPPISATIKVATEAEIEDAAACNRLDLPRSRVNGFDYDGATRTIKLYGACRPRSDQVGKRISVSYRYWIDYTPDPDGNTPPCGGPCPTPKVCNPITNQCECPADCGGCATHQACNVGSCACVCPPDCGGACKVNETCDTSTCTCQCKQDMTCGAGYRWDSSACVCACDTAALGCSALQEVDAATCSCRCRENCGDQCSGEKVCNGAACACRCAPEKTCPPNQVLDPQTCGCTCDPATVVCPADQQPDPETCACVCKPDCGGKCGAGTKCDPASCGCACDATAPCPVGFARDPVSCQCVCDTGRLFCTEPLVPDLLSCSCVCNPDCSLPPHHGGCAPGLTCDTDSCTCKCQRTCPAGFNLDPGLCQCVCDTAALACDNVGSTYEADPESCSCVCKPNCGGCGPGARCDLSRCLCQVGAN